MSSTATLTRPQEKTGNWSAIFPNETVTEQQSALFVKKLLAVAVSNITYLRAIFPEHAFGDRCLEDLNLKILRDDSNCPGACQVIKWVKGCFDALEKKYLRMLVIGLYVDPSDPDTVIESYTFKFSYVENGGGVDIYRNNKKISSAYTTTETKKATIRLLRTIVVLTQSLQSLPDDVMMTMKLLYHDENFGLPELACEVCKSVLGERDYKHPASLARLEHVKVTPSDYEPPGFTAAENENFRFDDEPMNIKVGDVNTPFHAVKLRIKTDAKQFEVCDDEKPSQTKPANNVFSPEPSMQEVNDEALDKEKREQSMEIENVAYQKHEKVSKKSKRKSSMKDTDCNQTVSEPEIADEAPDETTSVRPGIDDEAVTGTGSQTSNVIGSQEDFGVRCPCGCNEDDGLMILCANCKFWQHGVCFALLKETEAPERHICHMCALPDDVDLVPTDPHLLGLSDVAIQATCLWRRALQVCTEITRVIPANFSRRLGVEITVAQGLVNRLEKEGYIRAASRGKKLGKTVNTMKLKTEGLPKYFKKNKSLAADQSVPSFSQETEMDTLDPMMDTMQDVNKSKGKQKDVDDEISQLAQRAEEINLCGKWKNVKDKQSTEDKMESSHKEGKKVPPRSLKRVKSLADEDTQFDLSNSQEKSQSIDYTIGRRKKRKASVASRAIMV